MKTVMSMPWWQKFFAGWRKAECFKILKQQRNLLQTGLEATAEIMDATLLDDKTGRWMLLRLWIKLRKADGSFVYTHTNTVVSINQIPGKGETVRIKYTPDNFSTILIFQAV